MESTEIIDKCDRCGKAIPHGSAYISLNRNIEQLEHSIANNKDEVQVIQSDILLVLCGSCGNMFDTETMVKLIRLTPGGKQQN